MKAEAEDDTRKYDFMFLPGLGKIEQELWAIAVGG